MCLLNRDDLSRTYSLDMNDSCVRVCLCFYVPVVFSM